MRCALAGTRTDDAGPTAAMRPFSTSTVWPRSTPAEVIDTTFTSTNATGACWAAAGGATKIVRPARNASARGRSFWSGMWGVVVRVVGCGKVVPHASAGTRRWAVRAVRRDGSHDWRASFDGSSRGARHAAGARRGSYGLSPFPPAFVTS